jgi:hypothetical protein
MELGFSYLDLKKLPAEPYSSFLERSYFIINNKGKLDEKELIELSYYIYSIKYLGCQYNQQIMDKIILFAKEAGINLQDKF